jgi:hypothetical protein
MWEFMNNVLWRIIWLLRLELTNMRTYVFRAVTMDGLGCDTIYYAGSLQTF